MAIKSYKGFDKNLRCRDFQYKIGGIYEMDGEIKVCSRGFHACESPFDVFDYYTMIDSRFCEVEQDGNISKEDRRWISKKAVMSWVPKGQAVDGSGWVISFTLSFGLEGGTQIRFDKEDEYLSEIDRLNELFNVIL